MRVFAISDLHVDYEPNARWVQELSLVEYQDDVLILAGDVSDRSELLQRCIETLARRFRQVLFVPGNHDLWVRRDGPEIDSFGKFERTQALVREAGGSTKVFHQGKLSIVPLLGWYDGSFGEPGDDLRMAWVDFRACRWPEGYESHDTAKAFMAMNRYQRQSGDEVIVSYSHFLPRIDVMPARIPLDKRFIYPVLGSAALGEQVKALGSAVHVYGHSHVNRRIELDGTLFVNNAFAYPHETHIAKKELVCVYET
ncbi:metallophosphoesterase [Rhizobacter sp. J219]|uniref:metallophosphoesterase family protein n=1 Tax=Rhizobacter sp. J219 TaxID=2898430 RepID=UPI00215177B9|nr:metallophosphoesterase [Rhizobacter sp. J219]MCR5881574.1 metallophosphoesterase [Rhizobacter sp. J219]